MRTDVVLEAREAVERGGANALLVDDLTDRDLDDISWSGSPMHIEHVRRELGRVAKGDVEYLAVRTPSGAPIAKGGIDYEQRPDGGTLFQFATHPDLQRLGVGSRLVEAAEQRISRRGRRYAYLGVEDDNVAARRLYERLGYEQVGREAASWERQDEDGNVYLYETEFAILRRDLS